MRNIHYYYTKEPKKRIIPSLLLGIIAGIGTVIYTIYTGINIVLKATIGWTIPWLILAGVLLLITYL